MDTITYKGFTISPEEDSWAIKYGSKIKFTDGERVRSASSLEDAKEQIDEMEVVYE
jgi:hypothetical protein